MFEFLLLQVCCWNEFDTLSPVFAGHVLAILLICLAGCPYFDCFHYGYFCLMVSKLGDRKELVCCFTMWKLPKIQGAPLVRG